jgi:hypothetical protein
VVVALWIWPPQAALATPAAAREAAMTAAQSSLSTVLVSKIRNLDPAFNWIADSDRFWFKRETSSAEQLVVVDATTGQQSSAFDPVDMTAALKAAGRKWNAASELHITSIKFESGGAALLVDTPEGLFRCDVPVTRCETHAAPSADDLVLSPDGKRGIFRRANDLWLRDLVSGQERRLTYDGEPNFGYGDLDNYEDFARVARRRLGQPDPLLGVRWAPDSRLVVALRQDLRGGFGS